MKNLFSLPVRNEPNLELVKDSSVHTASINETSSPFSSLSSVPNDAVESDAVGSDDKKKLKNKVGFSNVSYRTHARDLGDNPSVSRGLPVTFRWSVRESKTVNIDEYEVQTVRSGQVKKISAAEREKIVKEAGHSRRSLNEAIEEIKKVQAVRENTEYESSAGKGRTKGYAAPFWLRMLTKKKHKSK